MNDDPAAVARDYVDAFNRSDADGMAACFAEQGTILDGMAPHLWHGPNAARDWYRDVLEEGEHVGAGGYHVTLGEPRHNQVTGDSAYVVLPAEMRFEVGGRPIRQTAANHIFAMRRENGAWRISAWAWAK